MITLFTFAPAFGLPGPGPFALKTEVHLRMLGLEYKKRFDGRANAPKGKLPYIDDDGTVIADSTFIRRHLEHQYSRDLDAGLNPIQRATAWAVERLAEDNLYWAMVHSRWALDENFHKGPAHFFDHLPEDIQEEARQKQRAAVLGYLHAQGLGRHNTEEIAFFARRGYDAQRMQFLRCCDGRVPVHEDSRGPRHVASAALPLECLPEDDRRNERAPCGSFHRAPSASGP